MSATVRIPTILRTYTGGAGEVTADGSTLAEVWIPWKAIIRGSGRGSWTIPAHFAASSMSTSVTTMCVSSAASMPRWLRAPRSRSFRPLRAGPETSVSRARR